MGGSKIASFMRLSFLFVTLLNGVYGGDTITPAKPLSGDQTIVSSGGIFELGFFQPGNSSSYYVCTWYKQIPERTPVWVANRDNPITDIRSAQLKISIGDLVLTNESNSIVWSTNLSMPTSRSVRAVLKDDGNLVLLEKPDSGHVLWQSFDHPTHTWLPGAKLGRNKKTKTNQNLIAWKNTQDPAMGSSSLELDPNGSSQYFILWNKTNRYWSSGPWDDQHKIFSLVPEMKLTSYYNFSYVDNENESYFTYSVYNNSLISRFFIDISGQIKQETWLNNSQQWNLFWTQPRQQCEVYGFCGAFGACNQISFPYCNCLQGFVPKSNEGWGLSDYTGGCVRKTQLKCGKDTSKKGRDKFWSYPNMKMPQDSDSVSASTMEECQSFCLRNCSCNAYAYDSQGCFVWTGSLLDIIQLSDGDANGITLYLRLAASEFSSKSSKKLVVGAVAGSAAGILVFFLLGSFLVYYGKKIGSATAAEAMEGTLVAFAYRDLQNATKNFSEKLGGGGFGSVFRGTLHDSTVVAVKKLESINQGEKQFRTEVSTIGTIQHVNLVRLRGFCSDGTRKLLVYDHMPNGSLDAHLFPGKHTTLDWKTRYGVALGTARGLAYLHDKCRDCIIHCDIKPENILLVLDASFCPKVADFGLAKLVGRDFSRVLTTMRGTRGYLAPEWISGVAITAKADVYSYGMMVFELVWGRRNTEQSEDGKIRFFPAWASSIMMQGGDCGSRISPAGIILREEL